MLAAIEQADVVLSVGCRYSSWVWDEVGPLVRRTHQHVNINIDPSALGAPALHDVGLQADAREGLRDLIEASADRTSRSTTSGCPRSGTCAATYSASWQRWPPSEIR